MGTRIGIACVVLACARPPAPIAPVPPVEVDDPAARAELVAPALDGYRAAFTISYSGARIGEARERFVSHGAAAGGYRFERTERIIVRRGGVAAPSFTQVEIDVDRSLTARRILVRRQTGTLTTEFRASRLVDGGWRVSHGKASSRLVDGAAVPSTLVPLLVAASGAWPGRAFDGPVLMEGAGMAAARLVVDIRDDRRVAHGTLLTAAGILRARALLDKRGFLVSAGGEKGVASRRVDEQELALPFDPPEIVESSALKVAGSSSGQGGLHLLVHGARRPPPVIPEIPEQSVTLLPGGAWDVRIEQATEIPGIGEIHERSTYVSQLLIDDLAVFSLAPEDSLVVGRGDCTAHAIVLKKLLEEKGYETRLATGYLLGDGALGRHRWVLVKVGRRWIGVDPTTEQVPVAPNLLALAVHGSSLDELAFVDEVAFAGLDAAEVRHVP